MKLSKKKTIMNAPKFPFYDPKKDPELQNYDLTWDMHLQRNAMASQIDIATYEIGTENFFTLIQYLNVTRGAGVGLSVIIIIIHQTLITPLNKKVGEDHTVISILLCAFAAKAVDHINGALCLVY